MLPCIWSACGEAFVGVIKPEEKAKFDIDTSKLNANFDDAG